MRFLHLRLKDNSGNILPYGGTTVGYNAIGEGKFLVTFARCSHKDLYQKDRGRRICISRFNNNIYREVAIPEGGDKYQQFLAAAEEHEIYVANQYKEHKKGAKSGKKALKAA